MKAYSNIDGDSGVKSYEYGEEYIRVEFSTGAIYLYTNEITGTKNIQMMKKLADSGEGLNAFINTTVRKSYAKKER